MKLAIAAVAFVVLVAPRAEAQPAAPSPQFQVTMDLAVALRAKNVTKVLALLARGAVLMPPNEELVSGTDIERFVKRLAEAGKVELAVGSLGSSSSEALGFDIGAYEFTITPAAGAPRKEKGKYVLLMRQGDDGQWRVAFALWNSSVAPAPAK
jgi:ketosteroid isomerase-like protein